MFSGSGFSCIRGNLVCPQWCLVIDEQGCKSCPCGPAGGMNAIAGGPSGNPVSMVMSSMGGGGGGHMMMGGGANGAAGSGPNGNIFNTGHGMPMPGSHSTHECIGTKLCMQGCKGQYELGPVGKDGCQSCTCKTAKIPVTSVSVTGTSGHCTECTETKPQIVYVKPQVTYVKPVRECTATLLCASTCQSGYHLTSTDTGGCHSCTCPAKHEITTSTIHYYTQIVRPATKECTHTAHCMSNCETGYSMSTTDTHGCPMCSCVQVERPYQYPIEIAVEPPPERTPQYTYTLSMSCPSTFSCSTACSVGYKCGADKCPTCECIHPAVVGLTIEHVHYERPVTCRTSLTCPDSCSLGYKCGPDGCPTCECLIAVTQVQQVRPQYTLQTCTHTLTCATTCSHGYEVVKDGSGGCPKCACKQPVYAVQRPQPQYAILNCPSTDSCASQCPYGHEIVRHEGKCPECRCVQRVSVGGGGGGTVGSHMFLLSGGGSGPGIGQAGGSGGASFVSSYTASGSYCPPIPPDCQPSCIRYAEPHCRRCECEIKYPQYQGLLRAG